MDKLKKVLRRDKDEEAEDKGILEVTSLSDFESDYIWYKNNIMDDSKYRRNMRQQNAILNF